MQNSNLNTNKTTSTNTITTANSLNANNIPSVESSEGWFSFSYAKDLAFNTIVNHLTAPTKDSLGENRVKKVEGQWGDLLLDVAGYAGVKLGINNEDTINNISLLIQEVLLALGTIREGVSQKLDSPDFGRHLIANFLGELFKHDLSNFDLEIESESKSESKIIVGGREDEGSESIESEGENSNSCELDLVSTSNGKMIVLPKKQSAGGEKELRIELAIIFDNLMLNAGLDKANLQYRHELIQDALNPGLFVQAVLWGARVSGKNIPKIQIDELKETFIEWGIELCKIQKRLEVQSCDQILDQNKGASELADYLVEEQIKSLQEDGLSLEFPFLVKKKNKEFLTSVINLVLSKETGKGEEGGIISQAWDAISKQLKIAIKAILAVVLNPTQKDETAKDRRNHLLDGILNRLVTKSEAFMLDIEKIDKNDKKTLVTSIQKLSESEGQYKLEAKKLFDRKDLVWQNEAQAFYKKAWHRNDKLTHDELLTVLGGWEKYSETDGSWTALNSEEAEALLARQSLTWENEAQNFLKVIEYDKMARSVLDQELGIEKFKGFFPKLYPASNVFQPLYQLIGEKSLELHEHISALKVKGEEAGAYLQKTNGKLTVFTDSLLTGFITAMEEKASKDEEVIDLGYPFLNDMLTHLIKKPNEGEDVSVGKEFVKTEVISVVEDVLVTVLANTIQNNCSAERQAADVFPFLINKMIEKALDGFTDLNETCELLLNDVYDIEFLQNTISKFGKDLDIKVELKNSKEELIQQAKELLIKVLARDLISVLLPQELFNSLLPPMSRKSKLWEMIGDKLIAPYISDIYEKVETFQSAKDNAESEAAKQYQLHDGIKGKIFPIIDTLVEKMNKGVSSIKFAELFKSKDKEKSQIDFSILDEYFGKALEKNGKISQLIESVVPSIIESIFAFHLNPKGEKTSQELATDLLWNLLGASSKCCETIDAFKSAILSRDDNTIFVEESLTKEHLTILAAFRKEKKIDPSTEMTANEFKQCCIWAQTNQVLTGTVNDLMDPLVPEALWNEHVPEHFRKFLTRAQVGTLLFDYLKDWYEFSTKMKALMHSGKEQVGKGNDLEDANGFIEDKVKAALADFCIPKDTDKADELWLKEILRDLLIKESSVNGKPITNLAIKYAYAILGKVLSGHIPGFSDSEILIKSLTESDVIEEFAFKSEKDSPLLLEINELRPAVQIAYQKLGALENDLEALTCENFSQISNVNLKMYLSAVHKPALDEHETILGFSNAFVIEDDRIVFKVQFQNAESKEIREVSLDLHKFIHWELVYRVFAYNDENSSSLVLKINELIPAVQGSYHKLNALANNLEAQTCGDFAQISNTNLNVYLSAVQEPALQKHEIILGFSNAFVLEEGRIVFKVQIRNTEKKEEREVSLDLYNFIYWDLAYKCIGSLIPKEGWKELMPEFLTKVFPKELLATFAIPYVKFAHKMQAPLQGNAEKGASLVDELVAEERSKKRSLQALDLETNVLPRGSLHRKRDPLERPILPLNRAEPRGPVNKHHKFEGLGLIDSKEHEKRLENIEKASTDLEAFIDAMVLDKISNFITDFANEEPTLKRQKTLIAGIPDFIDSLLREFLTTKVNVNIKQIRETLIKRAVYLIISEFLKPAVKDENGKVILSATKNSVVNIKEKLKSIIVEYDLKAGNQHDIAQKLVDEVLPKETWNTIFTEKDKEFIAREDIIKMVEESFVNESCKKIIILQTKYNKAIKVIKHLDEAAGLKEGKIGGLAKVVQTICDSIDSTIDEYSEKKGKIFDQPHLINEVAKELFRDETTSGIIKESAHALVTICIAKLFRVKKGESPAKLLEVLAKMMEAYDPKNFTKTAASWLKEIVPEKLRKALLPEFLHDFMTHEILAEAIFKDYMVQIGDVAEKIVPLVESEDKNVINMQGYVKDKLVALKNEDSRDGLSGFGGFVKNLEKVFLGVLDGDFNSDDKLKEIGPFLEKLLNANIAQVMTQPNVAGILDSGTFISEALAAALPMLGSIDEAEGYVELTDDQLEDLSPKALKKLGIALPRNKDEKDADFRARVKKYHFEVKSGEMIAEIMFPGKAASLLVPEIAKESVWNNVVEALGNQVGRVTNKDSRVLLAINLLGVDQENKEDKAAFNDLEEHLIDHKNLVGKEAVAEGLFKKGLKTLAMEKVDDIFAGWPAWLAPITWLARLFTKVVVSLALHFGVSQQAWNFVSSTESDEKLRRMIWKFLSFTKTYKPKVVNSDKLNEDLGTKVAKVMEDVNLLNGLQWFVGPRAAAAFKDKQVLSFLFPEEE